MKCRPDQLSHCNTPVIYLFGEDSDALLEHAKVLLRQGKNNTTRMHLDVDELPRFIAATRSPSLFGPTVYTALLRNTATALPAHTTALLASIAEIKEPHRLIICASATMYKKAWHKKIIKRSDVTSCEFTMPDAQGFQQWLQHTVTQSKLSIANDDLLLMAAQLNGLRAESRQWLTRLQQYDNGKGEPISLSVMRELCGEHSPESLDDWCHATAMRQPQAICMAHQLLFHQGANEIQMLVWLSNRFGQLLMFCWHQACHHANPLQQARVFGVARSQIPKEATVWRGAQLIQAIQSISDTEQQLKGASLLSGRIEMEALTMRLCRSGSL